MKLVRKSLMDKSLKEGLQDSFEFNQWVNDIIAEIRVILEDSSERSEKLIASDIKDDPFEKHEEEIEEMFMNNVSPSKAADVILDIMFKEIDSRMVENLNESFGPHPEILRQMIKLSNNSRLTQEAAILLSENLSKDEKERILQWFYHANRR